MRKVKYQSVRPTLGQPLAMALIATASCTAWAQDGEPNPYYIGANVTAARDSNVFRIPDGPHDYYTSTGLFGGLDQKISRQRLYASANVNYNKYHNFDALDNTSYGVKAGWDWETIEKLSGSFTGTANQNLASFNGNNTIQTTSRNLAKTDQLAAKIRWGGEGLITLEGDYGHSRVRYSAPEYFQQESHGDTGSVGAFYRLGASTRLGTAVRFTKTVSPHGLPNGVVTDPPDPSQFSSLTSKSRNLDLTLDWRYSVQTNMNARVSWTRQTFSPDLPQLPGYSGLTGAIYGNYEPTSKLTFHGSLVRDVGINSTFFNVVNTPATTGTTTTGTTIGLSENSQVINAAAISVRYAATAKIAAKLGYEYRHAKILNTIAATSDQTDNLRSTSFGLTYDIARSWQLACFYTHDSRSLSGTAGFEYTANVSGCTAQFTLR
jgi:hypothetical protein